MNRFEIIGNEADRGRARKLLRAGGFDQEWYFSYRAGEREDELEIWAPKPRPQIVPWLELNENRAASAREAVDGLREWSKITNTATITTVPGLALLYDLLREEVPGMRIIPGLKTNDALTNFDTVAGWERIAAELRDMAERTGSKVVVLENESAVEAYRLGQEDVRSDHFRLGLQQLPANLTIWWYPAMTGATVGEQERMEWICRLLASVSPNVIFLDHQSCGGPRGLTYSWSIKGREKLDDIVRAVPGTSIIPMLYFYGPGSRYWQDDQVEEALVAAASDRVIIYPGAVRFKKVAEEFVKALGAVPGAESKTISGESR